MRDAEQLLAGIEETLECLDGTLDSIKSLLLAESQASAQYRADMLQEMRTLNRRLER